MTLTHHTKGKHVTTPHTLTRSAHCISTYKCRDPEHVAAKARYDKANSYRRTPSGDGFALTPAGPAIAHLNTLVASGITLTRISAHIKAPTTYTSDLRRGRWENITKRRASAILRIRPMDPTTVNPVGTARRLQALQLAGWPTVVIEARAGQGERHVTEFIRRNQHNGKPLPRHVHDAITRVTRDIVVGGLDPTNHGVTKARAHRARFTAEKRGYLPFVAWDNIDDPNDRPLVQAVQSRNQPGRAARVRALWDQGLSDRRIADRMGITHSTVGDIRRTLGIPANGRYNGRTAA